jgi:hypothetical protein
VKQGKGNLGGLKRELKRVNLGERERRPVRGGVKVR